MITLVRKPSYYKKLERFKGGGKTSLQALLNVSPEQEQSIHLVYSYLTKIKGLSKRNASAIMGNIFQESSFNPNAVSSVGAKGLLQFKGDILKDYEKWVKTNPHHPTFGLLDYILYSLTHPEHDLYTKGYNASIKLVHDTDSVYRHELHRIGDPNHYVVKARKKEADNAKNLHVKIYGKRELENRLFPYSGLYEAMNDETTTLEGLTELWHDTVERSGASESNIPKRIKYAQIFYNYF